MYGKASMATKIQSWQWQRSAFAAVRKILSVDPGNRILRQGYDPSAKKPFHCCGCTYQSSKVLFLSAPLSL